MEATVDWTAKITPHFAWDELVTGTPEAVTVRRDGLAADDNARAAMTKTVEVAEWIRGLVGRPVRITSGYRGPDATGSQHDTGHALDLQVDGMSVLELLELVHTNQTSSPHPLRQVIAESLHTSRLTLDKPMAPKCGVWLHVAIATGIWRRPSTLPWATSVAPVSGRRQYVAWAPA
jgi:hypothetical protein